MLVRTEMINYTESTRHSLCYQMLLFSYSTRSFMDHGFLFLPEGFASIYYSIIPEIDALLHV